MSIRSNVTAQEQVKEAITNVSFLGTGNTLESDLPSLIEQFDQEYIEKTSQLPVGDIANIDPTDHIAMRKWLEEAYINFPTDPQTTRVRPKVPIAIKNVPISYGTDNHFSVRIYDPAPDHDEEKTLRPALIMIHGGGWIHGHPEGEDDLSKFFASELRAVVISVDYRLAPEYPFPAPFDDCFEALDWTINNSTEYKINPSRIGIWGASAGGQLAAAVALKDSAEHDVSRIRHVNLVVPAVCTPSLYPDILKSPNASLQKFPFFGTPQDPGASLKKLWTKYAGDQVSDPYASVLLSRPQANHPPVHITVAGCDGLRDEGIAYSLLLRDAGVDTQLEVIPGVPHGVSLSPSTRVAGQYYRNQARILNCALNTDF